MKVLKLMLFCLCTLSGYVVHSQAPAINGTASDPFNDSGDVKVNLDKAEIEFDKAIYLASEAVKVSTSDLSNLITINRETKTVSVL